MLVLTSQVKPGRIIAILIDLKSGIMINQARCGISKKGHKNNDAGC